MKNSDTRYEYTLVVLFFLSWGIVFMDRLAISFLMPLIQPELNITNTQIGLIGFVTSFFYAISAIVFGAWSDKSGYRKRWIIPFLAATGLFSAGGIFCTTFNQLLVVRTLVGIAEGPMLPLLMSVLAQASDPKRFGMNSGFVNAGVGAIGATLGPVFITQLVAHYSWNMTFLLSSIPTFVMVVLVAVFLKEVKVDASAGAIGGQKPKFSDVFKYRNIILCIFICILGMCGYWTLMLFAPLYLVKVSQLSVQNMGWVSSVMGILYILYCLVVPKLSDNFGRKPILIIAFGLSVVGPLCMYLFQGSISSVVLYVIFGGFTACMTPIYMTLLPMESVPVYLIATANAVVMGAGDMFGSAMYPIIAGRIADAKGLPFMMLFAAILLALAIAFAFGLKETHPRTAGNRSLSVGARVPDIA